MSSKRRHARITPIRIVPDGLPYTTLANPGNRALPSALLADRADIPVLPHRKVPDPDRDRTPAAGAPQ